MGVAVVHLNTEDKNGYLQSELPYCNTKNYLISASVKVKAYIDSTNCCDGLKDYNKCEEVAGCTDENGKTKLIPMQDFQNRKFSRDVILTGTDYEIKDTHHFKDRHYLHKKLKRRRKLFASTGSASGSCANRL